MTPLRRLIFCIFYSRRQVKNIKNEANYAAHLHAIIFAFRLIVNVSKTCTIRFISQLTRVHIAPTQVLDDDGKVDEKCKNFPLLLSTPTDPGLLYAHLAIIKNGTNIYLLKIRVGRLKLTLS